MGLEADTQPAQHAPHASQRDAHAASGASRQAAADALLREDTNAHDSCTAIDGAQQTQDLVKMTALQKGTHHVAVAVSSLWQELMQQPARWHVMMIVCFGVQLGMFLYFGLIHQR